MPAARWTTGRVAAAAGLGLLFAAAWGLAPGPVAAYTTTGESLGLGQRDMRVINSFADPTANDNRTPHPNFPGTLGAPMAIRKAHAEWSSGPWGGDGAGDPVGGNLLGSGGANFDNTWQGVTTFPEGTNGNVHVALPTGGGSTLAFTETPVSDGWRIIYHDDGITWLDGPGAEPGGLDIQAVATHEVGHTLGLGHSSVAGATMGAAIGGALTARSIEADDAAGIAAIYGPRAASKPLVTAIEGSRLPGQLALVHGAHFAPAGNEVWFTSSLADGIPLVVGGLASQGAGTLLAVVLPADMGTGGVVDGELLVHVPGTGGATLSNAFPLDVGAGSLVDLGPGLPGAGGQLPLLAGDGDLDPAASAGLALDLSQAAALRTAILFVGGQQGPVPFHGGLFLPLPLLAGLVLVTDASGEVHLSVPGPLGLPPGSQWTLQAWIDDPGAPGGLAGSNGLLLTVPAN